MTPLHRWPHYLSLKSKRLPRYRDRRFQMSCKAFLRLGKCLIKVRIYYLLPSNLAFFLQLCDFPQIVRSDANWGQLWEIAQSDVTYLHISDVPILGKKRTLSFIYFHLVCPTNFRIVTLPHTNTFTGIVCSVVQWAIALTSVSPPSSDWLRTYLFFLPLKNSMKLHRLLKTSIKYESTPEEYGLTPKKKWFSLFLFKIKASPARNSTFFLHH